MSTIELKKKLIQKIQSIDDEQLLREASRLIAMHLDDIEQPFELTKEMNEAIDEAKAQIKNGEYLSHEEANKEVNQWLGK